MKKAFNGTVVQAGRTAGQIDDLLRKHGIEATRWTYLVDRVRLEFGGPSGSFAITAEYALGDSRTEAGNKSQVMRALHWYVKAKLDAIDFGLEDMVQAFMPYLITAPNRTLIDDVRERVADRALGVEIPLLPEGR